MNAYAPTLPLDLPRRTFSVRDVEQMCEAGIMLDDERVELIFGELIRMSPKGARHETIKRFVLERWFAVRPATVSILPETTVRLSPETYLEPDVILFPSKLRTGDITPSSVLLAVEIADSSLRFDTKIKPQVYAYFGIPELWVIDAVNDQIHIFRSPAEGSYIETMVVGADETVTPVVAPAAFALRLDEIEREAD